MTERNIEVRFDEVVDSLGPGLQVLVYNEEDLILTATFDRNADPSLITSVFRQSGEILLSQSPSDSSGELLIYAASKIPDLYNEYSNE